MRVPSSFRDPSGYIFTQDGVTYRQVNLIYKEHYDSLMESGLYDDLVNSGLLIRHEEVNCDSAMAPGGYKVIKPEPIPFVTYPYEWCFSQLKDAALTTLRIQKKALAFGMTLEDSSAYNIQFLHGKPILIDTLSLRKYQEGEPWLAYRQFCQHFLAPLALASYRHIGLNRLLQLHIDGIPLHLVGSLLPLRTRFRPSLLIHIHLHARFQDKFASGGEVKSRRKRAFKLSSFFGLIDSLESSIRRLRWHPSRTEWVDYYEDDIYTAEALDDKIQLLTAFVREYRPTSVWDLGSNTGLFSRIASDMGIPTIAFDGDPATVEQNYNTVVTRNESALLPVVVDLANPSPKIGWANNERMDLPERGRADMLFALALIHHLAISCNIPLGMVAEFFRKLCHTAVVEFVPKHDRGVARLLANRVDIFHSYTQGNFENEFKRFFEIKAVHRIKSSERTLYLMIAR